MAQRFDIKYNKILKYLEVFKDIKTVFDNIKQEYNEEFEKDIINI